MNKMDTAKILIVNGVNLSQLGTREVSIYGASSFEEYLDELKQRYPQVQFEYVQSDEEGTVANAVANASGYDAVILNPGAYTHTSLVLADAVRTTSCRVIEVHISNLFGRENYRRKSMISDACHGFVAGFGLEGYRLAVEAVIKNVDSLNS